MLTINPKLKKLFSGILKDYALKKDLGIIYEQIVSVNNSNQEIKLDKKITDYDFLLVESGWGIL